MVVKCGEFNAKIQTTSATKKCPLVATVIIVSFISFNLGPVPVKETPAFYGF